MNCEKSRSGCREFAGVFVPVLWVALSLWMPLPAAAQNGAAPKSTAAPVRFTEAQSYVIGAKLELPGSIESLRRAEVASPVNGLVQELLVRDGDTVERGQVLAKLNTSPLEAQRATLRSQLNESKARLRSAEANHARARELFEAQVIAREQLDDSLFEQEALAARAESLQASIAEVELGIKRSVILAPFGGVVTRKLTELGEWIGQGDSVLELLSLDVLEVAVDVPEGHIGKVQLNQRAQVRLQAYPDMVLNGRVSVIIPEADVEARTFPVKISVSSGGGRVRSGMLATVALQPTAPRKATIVPKDALIRLETGWTVFALKSDDTVGARSVRMGDGIGEWIEVVGELSPGDRVITRGNERLADGQSVSATRTGYETP